MDEEFESLQTNSYIQKKKHKGKILVLFLSQKETRRVFNPSCSLCEQFILCPFLLCKRWTKSSSLSKQIHIYKRKSTKEKSLCFFWRRRRLDGFSTRRVRLANSLFYVPFCSAKDGRRVRVSPNKFIYTKEKAQRKNPCAFSGAKRDSTGFQPVVFALRTVYFMSLFAPQKMDEEFESLQTNSYIQKKKHKGKILVLFLAQKERLELSRRITRPTPLAGAPRHQLEYFCIGSVYDTIRLLKRERKIRFLF